MMLASSMARACNLCTWCYIRHAHKFARLDMIGSRATHVVLRIFMARASTAGKMDVSMRVMPAVFLFPDVILFDIV